MIYRDHVLWQYADLGEGKVQSVSRLLISLKRQLFFKLHATILHWDRFNHSSFAFWTWVVLYFTTLFLVSAVWWRNRKTDPDTLESRDRLVPEWVRRVTGILGAGTVLISLLFFLQPAFMIGVLPWKLTPLTARVMGTLFALAGAGAICIALDARRSAVRVAFQSQMIALALEVLALVFSWGDFRQGNLLTWVFVAGMLFLLVASPLFYLWMETRGKVIERAA